MFNFTFPGKYTPPTNTKTLESLLNSQNVLAPKPKEQQVVVPKKENIDLINKYKDVIKVYDDYYLINGMQLVPINKIIQIEKVMGLEQPKCEIITDDTTIYHLNIGLEELINILDNKNY